MLSAWRTESATPVPPAFRLPSAGGWIGRRHNHKPKPTSQRLVIVASLNPAGATRVTGVAVLRSAFVSPCGIRFLRALRLRDQLSGPVPSWFSQEVRRSEENTQNSSTPDLLFTIHQTDTSQAGVGLFKPYPNDPAGTSSLLYRMAL